MENITEEKYLTFSEYRAGILIWKVVPPILIIFGTIGNTLSIVVLTRRLIKTSTTALYLTFLAFSDLLVLYTGLLRQWLNYLIRYDVRHVSEAACKIHIWLVYSSLDFSAWILVAVTLERVISTWCPHSAKTKCNRKNATILLVTVLFLSLGLNAHLLFGMVFKVSVDGQRIEKCTAVNEIYGAFFNLTWAWIDLCAFCLIPLSVIVVGNGCILFKVIKSRQKTQARIQPSARSIRNNSQHNHSSMTAMLFTLNMVFLFTTSPVSIYNIGYPTWLVGASEQTKASLEFWWAVVNMLMYTNNSLNFLLYCLSGSRFRLEVKRLFCSKSIQRSNTALNDNTKANFPSNLQVPSHTPSASQNRDASPCRKPSKTLFTPSGDPAYSNGLVAVDLIHHAESPANKIQATSETDKSKINNTVIIKENPVAKSDQNSTPAFQAEKRCSAEHLNDAFTTPNSEPEAKKDSKTTSNPDTDDSENILASESYHKVTHRTIQVIPKGYEDEKSKKYSEANGNMETEMTLSVNPDHVLTNLKIIPSPYTDEREVDSGKIKMDEKNTSFPNDKLRYSLCTLDGLPLLRDEYLETKTQSNNNTQITEEADKRNCSTNMEMLNETSNSISNSNGWEKGSKPRAKGKGFESRTILFKDHECGIYQSTISGGLDDEMNLESVSSV